MNVAEHVKHGLDPFSHLIQQVLTPQGLLGQLRNVKDPFGRRVGHENLGVTWDLFSVFENVLTTLG